MGPESGDAPPGRGVTADTREGTEHLDPRVRADLPDWALERIASWNTSSRRIADDAAVWRARMARRATWAGALAAAALAPAVGGSTGLPEVLLLAAVGGAAGRAVVVRELSPLAGVLAYGLPLIAASLILHLLGLIGLLPRGSGGGTAAEEGLRFGFTFLAWVIWSSVGGGIAWLYDSARAKRVPF